MRAWLAATAAVLAAIVLAAQDRPNTGSLERPFNAGGRVRMTLSAGDYKIFGSPDERVRIDWSVRDAEALRKVRARAEVAGRDVTISTDGPMNRDLKFRILVPRESDLYVRLSAGDLRIEDIRGNKDVELRAGDMDIDVGRADDYRAVDASLWAGDITARPFEVVKGGLFRSFKWTGSGTYRLHAHLLAGDLRLYTKN